MDSDLLALLAETLFRGLLAYGLLWLLGLFFFFVELTQSDAAWPLTDIGWEKRFWLVGIPLFFGVAMAVYYSLDLTVRLAGGVREIGRVIFGWEKPNRGRAVVDILFFAAPHALESRDQVSAPFPFLRAWLSFLKGIVKLAISG